MSSDNEDKIAAASLTTDLSGQLIGAGLTTLGIVAGFYGYAIGERECGLLFHVFAFASAFFLVASIVVAGKGITQIRDEGLGGNWASDLPKKFFNFQALFLLLGLFCIVGMIVSSGRSQSSQLENRVLILEQKLETLNSKSIKP